MSRKTFAMLIILAIIIGCGAGVVLHDTIVQRAAAPL